MVADRPDASMLSALLVLGQVQCEDAGQDQQVVLAGGDVHRVDVAHAEPALGDRRHRLAAAADGELMVEQVAPHLQVIGSGDVDGEPVTEGVKMCLRTSAASCPAIKI